MGGGGTAEDGGGGGRGPPVAMATLDICRPSSASTTGPQLWPSRSHTAVIVCQSVGVSRRSAPPESRRNRPGSGSMGANTTRPSVTRSYFFFAFFLRLNSLFFPTLDDDGPLRRDEPCGRASVKY